MVTHVEDHQTVYMGTTYAGYVGLLTGFRPQAISISVDERDQVVHPCSFGMGGHT